MEQKNNDFLNNDQTNINKVLNNLTKKIGELNETIKNSSNQGKKLEQSNYNLQIAMFVLTAITTTISVFPVLKSLASTATQTILELSSNLKISTGEISQITFSLTTILTLATTSLVYLLEKKYIGKKYKLIINDNIDISDNLSFVLRDKDGNIKDQK